MRACVADTHTDAVGGGGGGDDDEATTTAAVHMRLWLNRPN